MADVFVYLRVSTDDKGQDPENQLEPCLEYIKSRDLGEPEIFTEKGSAWQRHSRPIFESMIKLAEKNRVKHIVVWRFDRVSRRRVDFLSIWTRLSIQGIKLHSVSETFIETINQLPAPWDEIIGRFMLEVVGWLSEEESGKKSDNVKIAHKKKKAAAEKKGKRLDWGRKPLEISDEKILDKYYMTRSIRKTAALLDISKSKVGRVVKEQSKKPLSTGDNTKREGSND